MKHEESYVKRIGCDQQIPLAHDLANDIKNLLQTIDTDEICGQNE